METPILRHHDTGHWTNIHTAQGLSLSELHAKADHAWIPFGSNHWLTIITFLALKVPAQLTALMIWFWDIAPWAPFAPQKQAELHSRHDVVARAANQLVAVFVDKLHAAQLSPASSAVVEVVHQLPHWASLPPGASSSRTVWAALLSGHHSMPHHCCEWRRFWPAVKNLTAKHGAVLIRCPQVSAIFNLDQADQEQDESETDESGNLNESEETRDQVSKQRQITGNLQINGNLQGFWS
ncbi:TPA: hypothetical protein ACH3X1_009690 [Trebouxia sp. C0004]